MLNEPLLIQRIAEGDEEAFSNLFHFYTSQLEIHINAIIRKPDAVEDIIQETFVKVWINRDKLPEILHLRAWIFTIASNLCFNFLRKVMREERRLEKIESNRVDSISPDGEFDVKEIHNLVKEALQLLSPQRKKIWSMHRDKEMKQKEIAEELNISLSTVKNTLSQSLEFIRTHLAKKGYKINPILLLFFL